VTRGDLPSCPDLLRAGTHRGNDGSPAVRRHLIADLVAREMLVSRRGRDVTEREVPR
jgi:hypothetical protein